MLPLEESYIKAVEMALAGTVRVHVPGPSHHHCCPNVRGMGSGIVMDDQGHILTNAHVVRDANDLMVTLPDGRSVDAKVIGLDNETDIAVVKVEADIGPLEFGDSDALRLGQPVLAIGNPLGLPGGPTVTSGVVSSSQRRLPFGPNAGLEVIQTDAAMNPGSSGGPIIDLRGRVVAVTTALIPFAAAIGFAIPANMALKLARQIIADGRVERPWLGIVGMELDRRIAYHFGLHRRDGIFITEVVEDGPVAAVGLRPGDVIVSMDGKVVREMEDLKEALSGKDCGNEMRLEVERYGKQMDVSVTLGTRPF